MSYRPLVIPRTLHSTYPTLSEAWSIFVQWMRNVPLIQEMDEAMVSQPGSDQDGGWKKHPARGLAADVESNRSIPPTLSNTGWDRTGSLSLSYPHLHLLFYVSISVIHMDTHLSIDLCAYLCIYDVFTYQECFVRASECTTYVSGACAHTHTHTHRSLEKPSPFKQFLQKRFSVRIPFWNQNFVDL